jgi:protein ImuB
MFACVYPSPGRPAWLEEFSPLVEHTSPDTVVLDARGMGALFGPPERYAEALRQRALQEGLPARVALASDPDTAVCLARAMAPGVRVVQDGEEARALAGMPLSRLEALPEVVEVLLSWGLRSFGDLAALPEMGVASRFGPEGVRLWRLARGETRRPLVVAEAEPCFTETLELEEALVLLEPLSFLLARLLSELCQRLEAHGFATNELHLTLGLRPPAPQRDRRLHLPYPMRDARAFLKLLQLDLEGDPPVAAVRRVTLGVNPVDPRVVQNGLFLPAAPEPERLELTLARIANLVGKENVGAAELIDTHRPGAFRMRRFGVWQEGAAQPPCRTRLVLRVYRPPLVARVEAREGRPRRVEARGIRGLVRAAAGPWRSSGDWWRADAWERDEWDVALETGGLYRLRQEKQSWMVEGSYD